MGKITHKDAADMSTTDRVSKSEWKADATHLDSQGNTLEIARTATLVVAANDSSAKSKAGADYVCDGTADDVEIQAAIDACPATGKVLVLEGTINSTSTIVINKEMDFECLAGIEPAAGVDAIQLGDGSNRALLAVLKLGRITGVGKATAGHGIKIVNATLCRVFWQLITGCDTGIYFESSQRGDENKWYGGDIEACNEDIQFSASAPISEGNFIIATLFGADVGLELLSGAAAQHTTFMGTIDCASVGGSIDVNDEVGNLLFIPHFYRVGVANVFQATSLILSIFNTFFPNNVLAATVAPITTATYELGTSSRIWLNAYITNLIGQDLQTHSWINLLENGDFEVGDPPVGWTAERATLTQEGTIVKIGSKSLKITCNDAGGAGPAGAYEYISDYTRYEGRDVTWGAWCYALSTNTYTSKLRLRTGASATFSDAVAKDDDWHWMTVTIEVEASPAYLNCYAMVKTESDADTDDILYVDGAILVEGDSCPAFSPKPAPVYGATLYGAKLGGALTLNGQVFDAGSGDAQINTTGSYKGLTVQNTQNGNLGARFRGYHLSSSPLPNDFVAVFGALGKDDGNTDREYGYFVIQIEDEAAGTVSGKMKWVTLVSGAPNDAMILSSVGDLWVDGGLDIGGASRIAGDPATDGYFVIKIAGVEYKVPCLAV